MGFIHEDSDKLMQESADVLEQVPDHPRFQESGLFQLPVHSVRPSTLYVGFQDLLELHHMLVNLDLRWKIPACEADQEQLALFSDRVMVVCEITEKLLSNFRQEFGLVEQHLFDPDVRQRCKYLLVELSDVLFDDPVAVSLMGLIFYSNCLQEADEEIIVSIKVV